MTLHPSLLPEIRAMGAAVGLNLVGVASARAFDRARPEGGRVAERLASCGTVVIVGSGGRGHWTHLWGGQSPPRPRAGFHPVDDASRQWAEVLVDGLQRRGVAARAVLPSEDPALAFTTLAEMAGLGTVSPVTGLLMHPEFGPWVSLRVAVLLEGEPLGPVQEDASLDFQPCIDCSQPCISACPSEALRPAALGGPAAGGIDHGVCGRHRHAGGCADGCAARRACPVGAEHRYGPDEEHFRQSYSLAMARRHLGLGWWRWVPRAVRQR